MGNANVMNVTIPLLSQPGTMAVGTSTIFGFYAPSDAVGGGITVTKVDYCSDIALAAASAPVFEVVTKTSAGVINGTISTALGSANWTAGTSRVGTLATSTFVDAGYGVFVQWKQTAASADIPILNASIQYVMGK